MQEQYPDVATGMDQLAAVVESFSGVVSTLEAEIDRFASADAIPTEDLPATTGARARRAGGSGGRVGLRDRR